MDADTQVTIMRYRTRQAELGEEIRDLRDQIATLEGKLSKAKDKENEAYAKDLADKDAEIADLKKQLEAAKTKQSDELVGQVLVADNPKPGLTPEEFVVVQEQDVLKTEAKIAIKEDTSVQELDLEDKAETEVAKKTPTKK